MLYHVLHIKTRFAEEWQKDLFDQQLCDLGIDTIDGDRYYIPSELWEAQTAYIQSQISDTEGASLLSAEPCPDENWNATWEAEHPVQELPLGITIVPHCAFGAGHHETTAMMIQELIATDLHGQTVLDHGTGTGVLAIFAKRLGAEKVVAVDIDEQEELAERYEVSSIPCLVVFKDGEEVKMSKRTGKAITHRELCEDVGIDAVRYFFAERAASAHLDFDFNLATEHSANNPVYYAQYAHARCCSILELGKGIAIDRSGALLKEESEKSILKHLNDFPSMIENAAATRSPNKVAAYIHKLAELFHEFYSKCRVVDKDNLPLTSSRLALIECVKITMENALDLLGVSAPEKM